MACSFVKLIKSTNGKASISGILTSMSGRGKSLGSPSICRKSATPELSKIFLKVFAMSCMSLRRCSKVLFDVLLVRMDASSGITASGPSRLKRRIRFLQFSKLSAFLPNTTGITISLSERPFISGSAASFNKKMNGRIRTDVSRPTPVAKE